MTTDNNYSSAQVEKLANDLCMSYQNSKFFSWYCGVIYEFGIPAVEALQARVRDAKEPGRLFTKIVNEWRAEKRARVNRERLHGYSKK